LLVGPISSLSRVMSDRWTAQLDGTIGGQQAARWGGATALTPCIEGGAACALRMPEPRVSSTLLSPLACFCACARWGRRARVIRRAHTQTRMKVLSACPCLPAPAGNGRPMWEWLGKGARVFVTTPRLPKADFSLGERRCGCGQPTASNGRGAAVHNSRAAPPRVQVARGGCSAPARPSSNLRLGVQPGRPPARHHTRK